jgi:apolipoprotein D and lipocalin family protein
MNKKILAIATCLAMLSAIVRAHARDKQQPLNVVPEVDLVRYSGQWYEIARLPNRFQKRCAGDVTANYALRADGKISVLNRCRLDNGEQIEAEGVARVAAKGKPNSILKVRFAPAFLSFIPQVWGDYQIIALSPDYTQAIVGDPEREYLWILARSPQLDQATYERLVEEAASQGFDVTQLQKTKHSGL